MILNTNGKAINSKNAINYQQLLLLTLDIQRQMATSPSFAFFNAAKVRRFYEVNNYRLQVLQKTMNDLVDKYVKKDKEGKPCTIKTDKGNVEYDFETADDKAGYGKEYDEFMSISFECVI